MKVKLIDLLNSAIEGDQITGSDTTQSFEGIFLHYNTTQNLLTLTTKEGNTNKTYHINSITHLTLNRIPAEPDTTTRSAPTSTKTSFFLEASKYSEVQSDTFEHLTKKQ